MHSAPFFKKKIPGKTITRQLSRILFISEMFLFLVEFSRCSFVLALPQETKGKFISNSFLFSWGREE